MSVSIAESVSSSLHDHDNNIVKLKLKKPKSWNWELSTSKSSPHICFPRILLYDDKNNLLAEANEADRVINGITESNYPLAPNGWNSSINAKNDTGTGGRVSRRSSSKTSLASGATNSNDRSRIINSTELIDCTEDTPPPVEVYRSDSDASSASTASKYRKCKRSVSTNSCDVTEFLEEFMSDLKRQGIDCKVRQKNSSERSSSSHHNNSIKTAHNVVENATADGKSVQRKKSLIETFNDSKNAVPQSDSRPAEIPILVYSERGLIQRDFNAKEFDGMRNRGKAYRRSSTCNLDEIKRIESIAERADDTTVNCVAAEDTVEAADEINRPRYGIQKSKSALDVATSGQMGGDGCGPKEKRKTRRVHSAKTAKATGGSNSILERLAQFKRRSSSTDSQTLEELASFAEICDRNEPTYRLQSSPAGTLVVCEESFRNRKVRRRLRKCSNIYEDDEPTVCPKKVVQKFAYNGEKMEIVDEPGTSFHGQRTIDTHGGTYNSTDKFPSRYEKAIANIDNLISKVILSHTDVDLNKLTKLDPSAVHDEPIDFDAIDTTNSHPVEMDAIRSTDNAFDGNTISTFIISEINQQRDQQPLTPSSPSCSLADASDDEMAIVNYGGTGNNKRAKQKKCKRKISCNHNNGNGNGNGNAAAASTATRCAHCDDVADVDDVDSMEKLKRAKKPSNGRKMRRSASAGSDRFNLSTSSDDGDNNGPDNGDDDAAGRTGRRKSRRMTKNRNNSSYGK